MQRPLSDDIATSRLARQLRRKGITDDLVLNSMASVPRELFVPESFKGRAYEDEALPIECGQTISQPYTVARMTQLLEPEEGMKVLEIGTGSGYQAAVLATMGVRVWSIERVHDLLEGARKRLDALGLHVATKCADGSIGWNEFAPYDGIVVTAGAPKVPDALLRQLAVGGRLVIPVGDRKVQRLHRIRRVSASEYDDEDHGEFRFVPLMGRRGWQ